jgi:hypothetical protein
VTRARDRTRILAALLVTSSIAASLAGACGGSFEGRTVVEPTIATVAPPVLDVAMPHPARARLDEAVRANAECERCHADVAAEWSSSLHHKSDVEPAYQRSFSIEPMPFCRSCHAPEAVATEEEPESVRDLGVGCVTCHVTESGKVLAVPRTGPEPVDPGPHAIVRDARFASSGACAGCHEFPFPTREPKERADFMQATIAEHAESPGSALACASCHMPLNGARKRNHAFVTSRDADVVRRAVRISASRLDATHVRVALEPAELGHAFPTGDLFRRIEISAEVVGPDEMVLGSAVRFLARHFSTPEGTLGRRLIGDDRVTGAGLVVDLDVGETGGDHPIAWRVAYQRVSHPNGIDERNASLEGELLLASGRLAPPTNAVRVLPAPQTSRR